MTTADMSSSYDTALADWLDEVVDRYETVEQAATAAPWSGVDDIAGMTTGPVAWHAARQAGKTITVRNVQVAILARNLMPPLLAAARAAVVEYRMWHRLARGAVDEHLASLPPPVPGHNSLPAEPGPWTALGHKAAHFSAQLEKAHGAVAALAAVFADAPGYQPGWRPLPWPPHGVKPSDPGVLLR